jgi:hypothetical protein
MDRWIQTQRNFSLREPAVGIQAGFLGAGQTLLCNDNMTDLSKCLEISLLCLAIKTAIKNPAGFQLKKTCQQGKWF